MILPSWLLSSTRGQNHWWAKRTWKYCTTEVLNSLISSTSLRNSRLRMRTEVTVNCKHTGTANAPSSQSSLPSTTSNQRVHPCTCPDQVVECFLAAVTGGVVKLICFAADA